MCVCVCVCACALRFETEISGGDSFYIADISERQSPSWGLAQKTGPGPAAANDAPPNNGDGYPQTAVGPCEGLLILHPEILVTPSRVSESVGCVRRGVLSDRVRSYGTPSQPATMGSLKHSFIEVRAPAAAGGLMID
jgi:hypothetical protein